jgi:flagellar biosynthesis GTPase FlhF
MAEGDTVKKKRRKQAAVAPEAEGTPAKAPRVVVVVEDVEIDTVARGKAPVMVWVDVEDGDTLRKRRVHRVVVAPPAPDGFHFDFDFDFDVAEMAPMPEMPMMVWEFNSALDSPAVRAKLDSLRAQAEQVRAAYREAMSEYAQERQKHREEIHVERRRITEEERERIRAEAERAREEAREAMEEAREEMEQAREEMREEMAKAREGMEVSRQKHEAFMGALRKDLAADGLLSDEGAPLQLYLSKRQLLVNGKEATEAQRAKYLDRFKRDMGAREGNSWSFSYPNTQLMIDLD